MRASAHRQQRRDVLGSQGGMQQHSQPPRMIRNHTQPLSLHCMRQGDTNTMQLCIVKNASFVTKTANLTAEGTEINLKLDAGQHGPGVRVCTFCTLFIPTLHHRRDAVLAMGAAVSALVLPTAPASAVVEGFSPMSALKGKDYGKSRMTCVSLISAFDLYIPFRVITFSMMLFWSQSNAQ